MTQGKKMDIVCARSFMYINSTKKLIFSPDYKEGT